jgi:hypothetical protein
MQSRFLIHAGRRLPAHGQEGGGNSQQDGIYHVGQKIETVFIKLVLLEGETMDLLG